MPGRLRTRPLRTVAGKALLFIALSTFPIVAVKSNASFGIKVSGGPQVGRRREHWVLKPLELDFARTQR